MKYNIVRACKHEDRVKVYELDPHDPRRTEANTLRVLQREGWKRCHKCSLHSLDK